MWSWANRHAGVISGVLTGAAIFATVVGALEVRAWLAGPRAVPPGASTLFVLSSDAWVPQAVEAITDDEVRLIYDSLQQRAVIRIPPAAPSP